MKKRKKGVNPPLLFAHARNLGNPSVTSGSHGTWTTVDYCTTTIVRQKCGNPSFLLHMRASEGTPSMSRDHRSLPVIWLPVRVLPVTSGHVTSGRSTSNTIWKPLIYYYCGGCGFKKDKRKINTYDYNEFDHLALCSSRLLNVISNQIYTFFREALIKGDGNRTIEINMKLNCLSIIKGNSVHMIVLEIVQQKFNTKIEKKYNSLNMKFIIFLDNTPNTI